MRLKEYEIAILFPWGAQYYYRKKIVSFNLDIHIHGILCVYDSTGRILLCYGDLCAVIKLVANKPRKPTHTHTQNPDIQITTLVAFKIICITCFLPGLFQND